VRLATWNINSIRARVHLIEQLAREAAPDVICLQETKVEDDLFPREAMAAIGYPHQAIFGMRAYHGVAVLSKLPLEAERRHHWCGKDDARHLSVTLPGGVELHNLYIPAGGDEPDPDVNDKFAHKLDFFREQADWWGRQTDGRRVLVGDLNVAPLETDVWSHKQLLKIVSHTPIEVEHFEAMRAAHDWVDAVRHFVDPEEKLYSWWSYRAHDWRASDKGRRLDHVWVTPDLTAALADARVLKAARDWERASDHAPVLVDLEV
jgi:exodeoxyribonuclease-3